MGEIARRSDTGEGPEVVDEVRLVEVTATKSYVRPLYALPASDETDNLLEAADAAEQLGR